MNIDLKYELFEKYQLKKYNDIYKHKIKELLNKKEVYILSNISAGPAIIDISKANWYTTIIFENMDLAFNYIKDNGLSGYMEATKISINNLLLFLDSFFYKGLTGILYGTNIDDSKLIYIEMPSLFNGITDTLIKKEYIPIINLLRRKLLINDNWYYIYHEALNSSEILAGIVRYKISSDKNNNYIDIFETRELAEDYCVKQKIINSDNNIHTTNNIHDIYNKEVLQLIGADTKKEKYPVTTVMNDILFYSIKLLLKKDRECSLVKIHTNEGISNINTSDFLQLVINTEYKQMDLS